MVNMSTNIKVYDDIIPIINMLNGGKTIDEKVNVSIAVGLFAGKVVTLARAAELSKISLSEFIDILKDRGITWGEYTEEDEKMDDAAIKNLLSRMENIND
jgi:predicted HTH domain antitoxin